MSSDPEQAVEATDKLVKGFHHAWLQMPKKKIVDDSETGPLGQLKDDLLESKFCLPDLTRIIWWWTDPERGTIPSPRVWSVLVRLGNELLGGVGKLLDILKHGRTEPFENAVRTYLARFDMERSLIPVEEDSRLTPSLPTRSRLRTTSTCKGTSSTMRATAMRAIQSWYAGVRAHCTMTGRSS